MVGQVVAFTRSLHRAGVEVNSGNLLDLCQSFRFVDVSDRRDFYAAARATLVSRYDDLETFDRVFLAFWEMPVVHTLEAELSEEEGEDPTLDLLDELNKQVETVDRGEEDANGEGESEEVGYSPDEALLQKDLAAMSDKEIEQARRVIAEIVNIIANRRSRRRMPEKQGEEIDFRRTWRATRSTAGMGWNWPCGGGVSRKAKLMLLCDVSGSMDCYSQFLIQFIYALKREIRDVEVGVFSTRMTPISRLLKTKGWRSRWRRYRRRCTTGRGNGHREVSAGVQRPVCPRYAQVQDGDDCCQRRVGPGDAGLMRLEMERLRRRVHKLVWLNPLLGSPGYQPLCLGMKTALPYLDYFLPAHNLESLIQLARTLRSVWR